VPVATRITVSPSVEGGSLALPQGLASAWKPGTAVSLIAFAPEAALLLREGLRADGYFLGDLRSLSVPDAFGHVLSGGRTGRLIVARVGVRKTVSFRDGQAVFATSTEPSERLGATLLRQGLLTQARLDEALKAVVPGVKLGQVLTRKGWLTPAKLYGAMAEVVQEIVVGLMVETEGAFLFLDGLPPHEDALKLPESTKELVFRGIKRSEALGRLRKRFPDELSLCRGEGSAPPGLEAVLAAAQQGMKVAELRPLYGGTEHRFFAALAAAVDAKVLVASAASTADPPGAAAPTATPAKVPSASKARSGKSAGAPSRPPAGPASPSGKAPRGVPKGAVAPTSKARAGAKATPSQGRVPSAPTEPYAEFFRQLCLSMKEAGHSLDELSSFLTDPLPGMEDLFAGVSLSDEGKLDVSRLRTNAGPDEEGGARVEEALDAFASYALFSAKNVLAPEVAESLSRALRDLQENK
jgi:hypothetical protein